MVINYLWDTNAVIYYLDINFSPSAKKFLDDLLENSSPTIYFISEMELLCFRNPSDRDLKLINGFIRGSDIIELEQSIKLKAIEVRKNYRLKLPDAIIAATALIYDLKLITRNAADFVKVTHLETINPFA